MEERKYIEHNGDKVYYDSKLKVKEFQRLSGILGELSPHFEKDDLTAGQFAGVLAQKNQLVDVVCIILNKDVMFVDDLPYELVMEVVNDFFFTNGLWLMVSGFIPMPSKVSEVLTQQMMQKERTKVLGKNSEVSEQKAKKETK